MTYSVVVEHNGKATRLASGQGFFKALKGAREASAYGSKARVVSDAQWFAFKDRTVRSFA